jgi:hypothetical protein
MDPRASVRAALELIVPDALLEQGGQIHVRTCDASGRAASHFFDDREEFLRFRLPMDRHVWFAPATRRYHDGKATGCVAAATLWVDVDAKVPGAVERAESAVEALGIAPAMLVASGGGGRHYWWRLADPVPLGTPEQRASFKRIISMLAIRLGGDPACAEPARVMRLPGTRNVKPEYGAEPPMATILRLDPDAVYPIAAFEALLPATPAPQRSPNRRDRPTSAAVPALPVASAIPHVEACLFVRHCADHAATLPEPLWTRLGWVLTPFDDAGRAAFHALSKPHPDYDAQRTDARFDYGRDHGYRATCAGLAEHGFPCPNLDIASARCRLRPVRGPAELLRDGPARPGEIRLRDDRTFLVGGDGHEREIAAFRVEFTEDRGGLGIERRLRGRVHRPGRPPVPLDLRAEVGGDRRQLARHLAALLGSDYRVDDRHLTAAWNAWLAASDVRHVETSRDFGFDDTGRRFVGLADAPGVPKAPLFEPGEYTLARRLGLRVFKEDNVNQALTALLRDWPELGCGPFATRALLAAAAWALASPVLEARDPAISPLCLWLAGTSGAGKSTTARIAQCLFGGFAGQGRVFSFGSTAYSTEPAAHAFRGALLVIDDAKRSALSPNQAAAWVGVLQRLHDRTARNRLQCDGQPSSEAASRATIVVDGEDVLFQEASIRARYLRIPCEEPRRIDAAALAGVQAQCATLPGLSAAMVLRWLAEPDWPARLHAAYLSALADASAALPAGPNRTRLARSVAALVVGWDEILGLGLARGVLDEAGAGALREVFLAEAYDVTAEQARVVREVTPGQRWLEDLRSLIAAGDAVIDGQDQAARPSARVVGFERDGVVHVFPAPSVELCNERLHRGGDALPPVESIGADLQRLGWLARSNAGRCATRVRFRGGLVSVWVVKGGVLDGAGGVAGEAES